jgi:uncharacterized repeat protein (TIGR02543 family)
LFGGSSYSYSLNQADFAPALREVEILSPCSSVGMDSFEYCDLLTKVVIPNSVVSIAAYAFTYCDNVTLCTPLSSAPSGWNSKWNNSNRPVVWGYSGVAKTYKFVTNGGTAVNSITTDMLTELPITTKEGAEFAGWYEDSTFSGSPIAAPYTGNKTTLYAKWIVRDGRSFDTAYIIDAGTSYSSYWSYSCTATGTMYFQFMIPTRYSSLEIFSIDVFGFLTELFDDMRLISRQDLDLVQSVGNVAYIHSVNFSRHARKHLEHTFGDVHRSHSIHFGILVKKRLLCLAE